MVSVLVTYNEDLKFEYIYLSDALQIIGKVRVVNSHPQSASNFHIDCWHHILVEHVSECYKLAFEIKKPLEASFPSMRLESHFFSGKVLLFDHFYVQSQFAMMQVMWKKPTDRRLCHLLRKHCNKKCSQQLPSRGTILQIPNSTA